MATPKKIIIKDLELADEEIARLRKENKELRGHKENLIRADKKKTEYIEELKKENIELKEKLEEVAKELIQHHEEYKNMADMVVELGKENKELKAKNRALELRLEKALVFNI